MGAQDGNNKSVNSKIEQIRLELEKKLTTIEKSKKNILDKKENALTDNNAREETSKEAPPKNVTTKPVFELTEPIEKVKPVLKEIAKPEQSINTNVESYSAKKNITDNSTQENKQNPEKNTVIIPTSIPKEKVQDAVKVVTQAPIVKTVKTSPKVSTPPKVILSTLTNKKQENNNQEKLVKSNELESEEKDTKKGMLMYLIYGLLAAAFVVIGFFVMGVFEDRNVLENERMEQKLSEFKNKRYLDSVELAELNTQILDLQSKKMLDSLDLLYEKELIAKAITDSQKKIKLIKSEQQKFQVSTVQKSTPKNLLESKDNTDLSLKSDNLSADQNTKITVDDVADTSNNNEIKDSDDLSKTNAKSNLSKDNNVKEVEVVNKVRVVKTPIFPGCEKKKTELDRKKCYTSKIYRHVSRKFNYEIAQNIGLKDGLHKIRINYIIDKKGYATVLNVRAQNEILKEEAIRVIENLPRMIAGTIDGVKSNLTYNIPITFRVSN